LEYRSERRKKYVLEDRHDNEATAKKEVVNAINVSVFRVHEVRKPRSKRPNELEDTAKMNRGPPWSTSSSSSSSTSCNLQAVRQRLLSIENLILWLMSVGFEIKQDIMIQ
jgi:hypothetical protein